MITHSYRSGQEKTDKYVNALQTTVSATLTIFCSMYCVCVCVCVCDKGQYEDRTRNRRAPELHRRRSGPGEGATQSARPVFPYGREEPILTGHHAADTGRTLQQPRADSAVSVSRSHDRPTSPDLLPVRRLRHETELRLAEAFQITT